MEHKRRRGRLAWGLLMAPGLAGCPDGGTQPPPTEFAYVVVNEVITASGAGFVWFVELDLQNQEDNGRFFLRFVGPETCVSETGALNVFAGRDWTAEFHVDCVEQPREVLTFSLRETGYIVTDRDSIPLVPEP